jgi:photosystem II stability/assembly factor-like uncharacterized protein
LLVLAPPPWFFRRLAGLSVVLTALLLAGQPATAEDTDQPIWRATHGVLLTIAKAGDRLVAAGDRGIVLISDDGGLHWSQAQTGTGELLTAAIFPTAQEGWVVGQDSTILHSTDAGAHWTTQFTAANGDQALFSIATWPAAPATAPSHLIATGAYALVLETQDGGAHWAPQKLPNLDEDYHLNCVLARGDDVVITGEAGHGFVRHDAKWTPMPVPYDGSQFGCLTGHDGAIYSFGLRGSLFVSTAAAPAWKRIETGEQRSIFGGTVLGSGALALVGSNGLVLQVDPATGKCRALPSPTGATLSGIVELSSGKWVIVGGDGVHIVDPAASAEVTQ